MQTKPHGSRTRLILLGMGALGGIIMAASGLVEQWTMSPSKLPANSVARVGGHNISTERLQQLLGDLATDKRGSLSDEDRRFALNRLIDEELLILRGLELGLAESSPEIRKAIAAVVIAQVVAEAEASPPRDEDLRRLYDSDPGFLANAGRYRLWWLRLEGNDHAAAEIAADAYARLSIGTNLQEVMTSTGLVKSDILPDTLLPLSKIRDYLGSDLIRSVVELQPDQYTPPVAANGDFHIFYLAGYQAGVVPDFSRARPLLEIEYTRRKGDRALREYLLWLRERNEIIVDPSVIGIP